MRRKPAQQGQRRADDSENAADKGERQEAGHDGGRREQNPELERATAEFIGFFGRSAVVAMLFDSLGLGGELLAPLARRGLGILASGSGLPIGDGAGDLRFVRSWPARRFQLQSARVG